MTSLTLDITVTNWNIDGCITCPELEEGYKDWFIIRSGATVKVGGADPVSLLVWLQQDESNSFVVYGEQLDDIMTLQSINGVIQITSGSWRTFRRLCVVPTAMRTGSIAIFCNSIFL